MTTNNPTIATPAPASTAHPRSSATVLIICYAALSWATVAVLILSVATGHPVGTAAWVRGVIVALTSLLLLRFSAAAAKGDRRAAIFLRVVPVILLVAVVGVIFLVSLPAWMMVEQAVCGVLLACLTVVVFRRRITR
jgi:hypothetical protein